jgi:hypothetical protein
MMMSSTPLAMVVCKCPDPLDTPTPLAISTGVGVPPLNLQGWPVRLRSGWWLVRSVPSGPANVSWTSTPAGVVAAVVKDQMGPDVDPVAFRATTCQK